MKDAGRYIVFFVVVFAAVWLLFRETPLEEPAHMRPVTDETFSEEVREADELTLVYFWATWCGTCRRLTPVLDGLAAEYAGRVNFTTVDLDHNPELAERYRVEGVPYIYLFQDGTAVDARVGSQSAEHFRIWIEEYL